MERQTLQNPTNYTQGSKRNDQSVMTFLSPPPAISKNCRLSYYVLRSAQRPVSQSKRQIGDPLNESFKTNLSMRAAIHVLFKIELSTKISPDISVMTHIDSNFLLNLKIGAILTMLGHFCHN